MAALQSSFLRALRKRIRNSGRLEPVRFYGYYFRWPLLLALLALLGEKLVFYGALPLEAWGNRQWCYFQAEYDFRAGRDQAALYRIRQALLETRDDPALWELAGKISDRIGSPEAPYCWSQADRLKPGRPVIQLALAQSALRNQEEELAAASLREMAPEDQGGVDYLIAAGRLATLQAEPACTRAYFEQAEVSQPQDPEALFALADWHAGLGTTVDQAKAVVILSKLATRKDQRLRALRELVPLEITQGYRAAAWAIEGQLVATTGAEFADQLPELDLAPDDAALESRLRDLLGAASKTDAPAILDWMRRHGRSEEALIWIRHHDEAWQDDPDIGLARAQCLEALDEWTHLRDDQRDSVWPGHEATRLMLMAKASWRLGRTNDAESAWHRAVAACIEPKDFSELAAAAADFPDGGEARAEAWLALANRFPGQQWPWRALLRYEMARGDWVMAREMAAQLATLAPREAAVNATRDLLCLLRGTATRQATADLARLDAIAPTDPTVATAAGYSLYLDGHFDEALAAVGALDPAELRAPERAVYIGQLLAAAGPVDQVESMLRLAQVVPGLADKQRRDIDQAIDLVSYRRAMAALLQPADPAARQRARDFFLARVPGGEPVFLIGAAVALLPDRDQAAALLARIDARGLDRVELKLDEGAVLALAGPVSRGAPYLELVNGLPVETPLAVWSRIVDTWWELTAQNAFDPSTAAGLLAAYRGLENAGPAPDFWRRDETRELQLTRAALQSGVLAEPVQARLEALLQHVPATPEMEAEIGYALFLQGRMEAGRQRLEVLSDDGRRRPEVALYYAAILRACGETKRAQTYTLLAARTPTGLAQ